MLALYGLYKQEIETWVDVSRRSLLGRMAPREHEGCAPVRCDMERSWLHPEHWPRKRDETFDSTKTVGHFYTSQEFTARIYECGKWVELGAEAYGTTTSKIRMGEVGSNVAFLCSLPY